ncbi:hypothetical protein TNCV_2634391 [Trichonephila clavipes]|nr:hypothetical protein TNCV_2634391 [Trichonephila clavipes]
MPFADITPDQNLEWLLRRLLHSVFNRSSQFLRVRLPPKPLSRAFEEVKKADAEDARPLSSPLGGPLSPPH